MQLILTQTDIEIALKNYVAEILTIREGMVITVDLKATRGPDGATAVIDIVPAGTDVAAKADPVKPARTVTAKATEVTKGAGKGAAAATTTTVQTPEVPVETGTEEASDLAIEDTTTQVVEDQPTTTVVDAGDAAPGQVAETVAVDPVETDLAEEATEVKTTPAKSLFSGLRSPKNT